MSPVLCSLVSRPHPQGGRRVWQLWAKSLVQLMTCGGICVSQSDIAVLAYRKLIDIHTVAPSWTVHLNGGCYMYIDPVKPSAWALTREWAFSRDTTVDGFLGILVSNYALASHDSHGIEGHVPSHTHPLRPPMAKAAHYTFPVPPPSPTQFFQAT